MFEGIVHLGVAFGLAVLFAESHGAEAEPRNFDAGTAKRAVIHTILPLAGPGSAWLTRAERHGARPFDLLVGLFGCEERGKDQPQHEGRNGDQRDGRANFAEM
jgi:hypothetical protein